MPNTRLKDATDLALMSVAAPLHAGLFPKATFPAAYTNNSVLGHNDLYTVPSGRKAIVLEHFVTNPTGSSVGTTPEIKISGVYYKTGTTVNESSGGVGHNYGYTSTRSAPIVLNAGETFSIEGSVGAGASFWCSIIEYDANGGPRRASITSWSAGNNTLLTVLTGQTIFIGTAGATQSNLPTMSHTGIIYVNHSGGTRTLGGIYLVPSGGSVTENTRFAASNSIFNGGLFSKYFSGNLAPGDTIVLASDSAASGQIAWCNYVAI